MFNWLRHLFHPVPLDTRLSYPRPFVYIWKVYRRGRFVGYKCRGIPHCWCPECGTFHDVNVVNVALHNATYGHHAAVLSYDKTA